MGLIEKLKLLIKARQPITDIITELKTVKSGWKTISFWVSVLASLLALVAALQGVIPGSVALVITTGITLIYNILRGAIKSQVSGQSPFFQTSEFWLSLLTGISTAIVALQTGGINPAWFKEALLAISVIGGSLAAGQNLAGQQPGQIDQNQNPINPSAPAPAVTK